MAFGPRSNTHIAKYSKLLGQIYLESEAAKSVLGAVPDEVKRAGFNDKTSRELCKQIQDGGGLLDSSLEGELADFAVSKGIDAKGIECEYIQVGIRTEVPNDKGELKIATVFLSVPLKSDEGLSLMHKLVNAKFGEDIKLTMFGREERSKDGRVSCRHVVGLKQHDKFIESDFPYRLKRNKSTSYASLLEYCYKKTLPQVEKVMKRFNHYRASLLSFKGESDESIKMDRGVDADSHEDALPNETAAQDTRHEGGRASQNDARFDDLQSV
ncbi:MAG: hypothetical protein ACYCQL_00685 [Acidithiobacillus sp.]